jgi:predicted Rossmann fold nucleotide-binding protein DprA/Smf involved in DNA uptake
MTFESGIKKYYKQIVEGDALVVSTFFPRAPWSVQLAMGRNPYIYGLAQKIFVAESGSEGGTWSGVVDGLRKGRTIYVRNPDPGESNANAQLIAKGAIPVDSNGTIMEIVRAAVGETDSTYDYRTSKEGPSGRSAKKDGKRTNNNRTESAPELPFS